MRTVRLQVTLREVTPAVLRVVDVPASCTLSELHDLLQVAMDWTDSHLHEFLVGDARYGVPIRSSAPRCATRPVSIGRSPTRFGYLYDFGDG